MKKRDGACKERRGLEREVGPKKERHRMQTKMDHAQKDGTGQKERGLEAGKEKWA